MPPPPSIGAKPEHNPIATGRTDWMEEPVRRQPEFYIDRSIWASETSKSGSAEQLLWHSSGFSGDNRFPQSHYVMESFYGQKLKWKPITVLGRFDTKLCRRKGTKWYTPVTCLFHRYAASRKETSAKRREESPCGRPGPLLFLITLTSNFPFHQIIISHFSKIWGDIRNLNFFITACSWSVYGWFSAFCMHMFVFDRLL